MKSILFAAVMAATQPVEISPLRQSTDDLCRAKTEATFPGEPYTIKTRDMTRASAESRIEVGAKRIVCRAGLNIDAIPVILRFLVSEDFA